MDEYEIARRVSALPDRFAARLPNDTLEGLRLMEEGGEYGELTIELVATLAKTGTPVSADEINELRVLLEAANMSTEPLANLNIRR